MRVLILELWDLHLGYGGCYGNDWVATPTLDKLAAEGVTFDQHYASCVGDSRSVWTGRYQFPGGGNAHACATGDDSNLKLICHSGGIPFYAVGANRPRKSYIGDLGASLKESMRAIEEILDQVGTQDSSVIWADLPSLQPPWRLPEKHLARYFAADRAKGQGGEEVGFVPLPEPPVVLVRDDISLWERLQLTYAAVVTFVDSALGELLEELAARGVLDDVLLVLTAERGLTLGEHGVIGTSPRRVHEELIHLPLILRFPGSTDAGCRVSALTQPVDLMPTILDFIGLSVPANHGQSLLPLVRGEIDRVRAYACCGAGEGDSISWYLRSPEWALLLPVAMRSDQPLDSPQLFVKPDDRWEVNDVRQQHQELAEHLEETLRAFVAATWRPGPLQPPQLCAGRLAGTGVISEGA
jgi:hypothetical protein